MSKVGTKGSRKRVQVLATLGAEAHRQGLGYEDRDAFRAVLDLPLHRLTEAAGLQANELSLGQAIAHVIFADHGPLTELGQSILRDRQKDAYKRDCASWDAQPEAVKKGKWREKAPTRDQQLLMMRMAMALDEALPGDVTRGEAQDWIAERGGNPRFTEER